MSLGASFLLNKCKANLKSMLRFFRFLASLIPTYEISFSFRVSYKGMKDEETSTEPPMEDFEVAPSKQAVLPSPSDAATSESETTETDSIFTDYDEDVNSTESLENDDDEPELHETASQKEGRIRREVDHVIKLLEPVKLPQGEEDEGGDDDSITESEEDKLTE